MDIFTLAATIGINLDAYEAGINRARGLFGDLERLLQRGLQLAIRTTWDFGKDVIETGSAFDKQMAAVQAVLGKEEGTVENMVGLRERALEVAEDSVFTSEEVAKAYYYMGMAGWKAEKMSSGLPGVIALAAASGEDLAMVSDIVTDSLTAFGLSADRAQEYADILAQTATNSNTDVRRMGKTFQYIAPIAGQLGVSVEDAALSIGLMANSAIKSSMAGTAFRQILTRITTNAGATKTALGALEIMTDKLGVTVFDTSGNLRDWSDILEDTRKVWGSISPTDQIYYAKQIASLRGMPAWLALMNTSQESWNDLSESLSNASGAAQTMADVRLDSLSGDVVKLNAAFDVMKIAIYDDVKGPLREVVQDGTESVKHITDAINENGLTGGIEQIGIEIENVGKKWAPALEGLGKAAVPIISGLLTDVGPALLSTAVDLGVALGRGILDGIANCIMQSENPLIQSLGRLLSGGEPLSIQKDVEVTPTWVITEENATDPLTDDQISQLDRILRLRESANAKGERIGGLQVTMELESAVDSTSDKVDKLAEAVGTTAGDVDNMGKDVDGIESSVVKLGTDIDSIASEASNTTSSNLQTGISTGGSEGSASLETSLIQAGVSAGGAINGLLVDNITSASQTAAQTLQAALVAAGNAATAGIQAALRGLQLPSLSIGAQTTQQMPGVGRKKHASAMAHGEILQGLTPFGVDSFGTVHYGGEAGPEAVVGVNSLDGMIQRSVQNAIAAVLSKMDELRAGQNQGGMQVVLDSGALVGAIAPAMDERLYDIAAWRGGGRA